MDFSAAELKRLLCRKPYNCGPQSNSLPEELFQHGRFQRDHLMIMRENYHGVAILSRCSGCDKLAVRRLNMIHPEWKAFIDLTGMCEVPGVGVQQGKGLRRNLFAGAFLYPHQCLGVDSMKEVVLLGGMPSVDDMNRGFPLEETAEEEEEDPDPEATHGAVISQRQTALECWKVADSHKFSFRKNDKVIPLRAIHLHDGFGKSGLCLYYSNHLGHEVSSPLAEQLLGEFDPQSFEETIHASMTSPVYDDTDRFRLKQGEACFNISKNPHEFNALVEHKIITPTEKTLQIGGYPTRHPVCRINLPLYKREESG